MTKGAGHDGSGVDDKTTTAGETKAHDNPEQEEVDYPYPNDTLPQPMLSYPELDKGFRAAAKQQEGHDGSEVDDKTTTVGETKGAGHDGSGVDDKTTTAGETKAHDNPVREYDETAEGMTKAMKTLFPQVDGPHPLSTQQRRRRFVEDNLQTPGQPFLPYVPLDEGFRAAGEKSFLIGAFVKSWDKMMAGEVDQQEPSNSEVDQQEPSSSKSQD